MLGLSICVYLRNLMKDSGWLLPWQWRQNDEINMMLNMTTYALKMIYDDIDQNNIHKNPHINKDTIYTYINTQTYI